MLILRVSICMRWSARAVDIRDACAPEWLFLMEAGLVRLSGDPASIFFPDQQLTRLDRFVQRVKGTPTPSRKKRHRRRRRYVVLYKRTKHQSCPSPSMLFRPRESIISRPRAYLYPLRRPNLRLWTRHILAHELVV